MVRTTTDLATIVRGACIYRVVDVVVCDTGRVVRGQCGSSRIDISTSV